MSEPYLTDLGELATQWHDADGRLGVLECRHFFSGAAVYRDGSIVASLTPVGLAFKVPDDVRDHLLASGRAAPLRYFPGAPIKRNCRIRRSEIMRLRGAWSDAEAEASRATEELGDFGPYMAAAYKELGMV